MLKKLGAAAVVLAPGLAFATDPIDVSATVTTIGTYVAPIASVGLAVLAVVLAVKGIKWIRRAM